jgi:hypothetical protein
MTPSLADAIAELAATGVGAITVVPVFFGQGGHLRRDFPLLIDACRASIRGWTSAFGCGRRSRQRARCDRGILRAVAPFPRAGPPRSAPGKKAR